MFTLPSVWNLIISTVVFFVAAWQLRRYLDEQGIPKGATRSILVFVFAYLLSWGAGETADRIQEKISGPQTTVQALTELPGLPRSIDTQ